MDLRPGRAPRPWTEGDADAAGLATEVEVGGAAAGVAWGSDTAGRMSETIRGGKSGDGDAVAEAGAEAEAEAEFVLETGPGLFLGLVFVVLAILSTSPCAVASPVMATGDGAGTVGGGSSTLAGVLIMWPGALTADSMCDCDGVNWMEARRCWQGGICREPAPFEEVSGPAQVRFESQQTIQFVCPVSAWSTHESFRAFSSPSP